MLCNAAEPRSVSEEGTHRVRNKQEARSKFLLNTEVQLEHNIPEISILHSHMKVLNPKIKNSFIEFSTHLN
jgi:hypothetical protein